MRLLVVEDDVAIGKAVQKGFEEAGHECIRTRDGERGLQEALSQQFDAVILDLLLPGVGGLEILGRMRAAGLRSPVILLTALGSIEDRVAGLQAGADDYLVKPFAFAELAARLDAVSRRVSLRPTSALEAGPIRLDLATRRVECGGKAVELTPTEFSILELLLRHSGQVVTRKMLCDHLWEADWEGVTNVIEVHLTRLRGKLGRAGGQDLIQTVRGRGYAIRAS